MNRSPKQARLGHPFDLPPRWLWIRWPLLVIGGSGTAYTLISEELAVSEVCIPMAGISGLAAIVFWFNHYLFKASRPRPEDIVKRTSHRHSTRKKD